MSTYYLYWIFLFIPSNTFCFEGTREIRDLLPYKQADDADSYYFIHPSNHSTSCTRQCVKGDRRICYYKMILENYAVLSSACRQCLTNSEDCDLPQCVTADGYEKEVLTANRRIPGPGIQVCFGDRIVVDVVNNMLAKTVSIHWHGIVQKYRNHMDGVPFVNQCPIQDYTTFRYDFRADTVGTMYWHSHSALHKLNGLQGSLIVRQPKEDDLLSNFYDYDFPAHVISVFDWTHSVAEIRFPGLIRRDTTLDTTFYLINGKGRCVIKEANVSTTTPYHVFHVRHGFRYRFRVIGAVCTQCPAMLQIEGHKLLIVATDGSPVKPVLVDSLIIYSGERYDFILHTFKKVDCYWIVVRGLHNCLRKDVFQLAILRYEGSREYEPQSPKPTLHNFKFGGVIMNPEDASCGNGKAICVSQLRSLRKVPRRILALEPHHNIEFKFGFHGPSKDEVFKPGGHTRYLQVNSNIMVFPWINKIQMLRPPSPLQNQYDDIPKDLFCPNDTHGYPVCPTDAKNCCSCIPVVRIPLGDVVQFVLIDIPYKSGLNHPFHLHGTTFNVLSMGYLPKHLMNAEDINRLLKNNKLPLTDPPAYKDTLAVPSGGYAVIRFIAKNPGYWFFHCHFAFHHEAGMSTIIKVGEHSQFPKLPQNFPKCGDYLPSFYPKQKNFFESFFDDFFDDLFGDVENTFFKQDHEINL